MSTFRELGVSGRILKAIEELGFENPMPVQEAVIPYLLEEGSGDVVALAQTGTGKTAAYGIPVIQQTDVNSSDAQFLILSPTRELCVQIASDLADFSHYIEGLHVIPMYGGSSIENQIRNFKRGAHVIVATPGRLIDLMERGVVKLDTIRTVILDEADEMLNMGFSEDLEKILSSVPVERKMLMFSATMSKEIQAISKKYLHDAREIVIGTRNEGAENVEHVYYMVHAKDKYLALKRIVDYYPSIYAILSGKESRQAKEDDICLNTIQQYCSYTYYSQMSALAERQLQNASLALQKVRREYSLGSKSQQDVLEKEVFEANAENTFAEYNALKNKALMELKSAMFYPAADSLVVDTIVNANNAAPISDAQQTALSAVANNANTVIAKNNMEIKRIELNTARWQLLPRITMDANWYSYRTTYPDNKGASISFYDQMKMHEQKSVGVRISIPIYGRLGKFSNISRKKSDYRIASYEYDERCREIENAVYSAYDDAASAEKSLQAAQKAATLNQKYFEAAQLKFDLGMISYIDFNEVYNKYLESQAKYYNALYTYMIKNAVVEYYRGTPYLEQF